MCTLLIFMTQFFHTNNNSRWCLHTSIHRLLLLTLKNSCEILMRSPSPSHTLVTHTSQRAINGVKTFYHEQFYIFYLLILCKEFQFFWHLNVLGRGKVKDSCCLVYTCVASASSHCRFQHLFFSLSPSFTMRSVK